MRKNLTIRRIAIALSSLAFVGLASTAVASHSWGGYHWARTSNPFTLKIGDNVTAAWDGYLDTSVSDWSQSSVLDLVKVTGKVKNVKRCSPTLGQGEVCNAAYGYNGWLGVAQVWVSGGHITQGVVKMNDSYFQTATYNTPAWRNMVMCQEVGHILGLDHQDENFNNANLGTCMDYTNNPSSNQHPNQHDYAMLEQIYAHVDATTTVGQTAPTPGNHVDVNEAREWGQSIRTSADGKTSLYVRDTGLGQKVFTFVVWVQ